MSTKIPLVVPNRSYFDLSHMNILTFGFGELIPTFNRLLLPGDSFHIRQSFNTRFLALLAPIMHRVTLSNDWFFVPLRTLWPNFEDFISPEEFLSSEGPAMPFLQLSTQEMLDLGRRWENLHPHPDTDGPQILLNSLLDYFDLLPSHYNISSNVDFVKFNPMPIAALRKIWNDFYRDENLQEKIDFELRDGQGSFSFSNTNTRLNKIMEWISPLARAYHGDYFTRALPFTQKGNPVFIPFGVQIDVDSKQVRLFPKAPNGNNPLFAIDGSSDFAGVEIGNGSGAGSNQAAPVHAWVDGNTNTTGAVRFLINNVGPQRMFSDLFELTGISATAGNGTATINDLRTALALQRWLERNARGGTRYVEYIFAHFGVVSPDARLQRAEWVGGNTTPIQISEVLQTSGTGIQGSETPLGVPAGSAYSAGVNRPIMYKAREHGILMCVSSLMFDNVYASGQDREWRKFDRFEFFTPSFQNIGEQEVFATELGNAPMEQVFGYNPRYEEYRVQHSRVHGDMRQTLDFWHLARRFGNAPNLNGAFLQSNNTTLTDRIFPYAGNDPTWQHFRQFLAQMHFAVKAFRPVPKFGLPGGLTI